jgi:hypothetical protein
VGTPGPAGGLAGYRRLADPREAADEHQHGAILPTAGLVAEPVSTARLDLDGEIHWS